MIDEEAKKWNKTAKKYFEEVISPFQEGVKNPIFAELEKLNINEKMNVVDIGCGIGNLLPTLAENFSKVVGIDFSPKMVELSRIKVQDKENVEVKVMDARNLSLYHDQFDVAIAVNSILLPQFMDLDKMFSEMYRVLKKEGILLGIFPAMEGFLYLALLMQEKAMEEGHSQEEAIKISEDQLKETGEIDYVTGIMKYSDSSQKNYYLFELKYRLWKAGFTNIKIKKIYYPWEAYEEDKLMQFKGKEKIWDWFVSAKK